MKKIAPLLLLTFLCQNYLLGQKVVTRKNYENVKKGVYISKSTLKYDSIGEVKKQVKHSKKKTIAMIYIDKKPVYLFKSINDKGKDKPIGVLKETSFIEIDTTFEIQIYDAKTKKWNVTFNVWYAIKINGKRFYTDYQPHNIQVEKQLKNFKQKFLLVCQSTGYDYYYDSGYPEKFFAVFLDSKDSVIYQSKTFDFTYGDEYWEDSGSMNYKENPKKLTFELYGEKNNVLCEWDGKKLITTKKKPN